METDAAAALAFTIFGIEEWPIVGYDGGSFTFLNDDGADLRPAQGAVSPARTSRTGAQENESNDSIIFRFCCALTKRLPEAGRAALSCDLMKMV